MKKLHNIVLWLFVLVSVGMVCWAISAGMDAPASAKIANATPLVQQLDDEGVPMEDENGEPVSVATTEAGIESLGYIFANQLEEGIYTEAQIAEKQAELENIINVLIPEYEAKVAAKADAAAAAEQVIAEIGENARGANRRRLEEAQAVKAEFAALNDTLNNHRTNVDILNENIAASITANADAKELGEGMKSLATAIHWNLMWFYFLMAFSIAFVIINWLMSMFQNKGSLVNTLVYLVVVGGIVGVAYWFASGNGWAEGATLKDAAGHDLGIGTDPATRTVFGEFEYMIADTSILITYIAAAGAVLGAVYSAVISIFKS